MITDKMWKLNKLVEVTAQLNGCVSSLKQALETGGVLADEMWGYNQAIREAAFALIILATHIEGSHIAAAKVAESAAATVTE